jgi:hypothetical protein
MVLDGDARMRWFLPTENAPFDLQCQVYKGQQVLTWWQGVVTNGTGAGEAVLVDMSFNPNSAAVRSRRAYARSSRTDLDH